MKHFSPHYWRLLWSLPAYFVGGVILLAMVLLWGKILVIGLYGHLTSFLSWDWSPHHREYGILPMLVGALALAIPATGIGFFWALALSIFIYVSPAFWRRISLALVQSMASVPSLLFALAGAVYLVPFLRANFPTAGPSLLATILTLSFFILPFQAKLIYEALLAVDHHVGIPADLLGFNKTQKFLRFICPRALPALLSVAALGLSRAFGDTMIALLVSGNSPQIPDSLWSPVRVLTAHIALVMNTDTFSPTFTSLLLCIGLLSLVNVFLQAFSGQILRLWSRSLEEGEECKGFLPRRISYSSWKSFALLRMTNCSGREKFLGMTKFCTWQFLDKYILEKVLLFSTKLLTLLFIGIAGFFLLLFFWQGVRSFSYLPLQQFSDLLPGLVGTITVVVLSSLLALPLGISLGVWSVLIAGVRERKILQSLLRILASFPSITIGALGYLGILWLRESLGLEARPCLLLTAVCLCLLVLPVIVHATEQAIMQVPAKLRLTGLKLGLSPLQNIFFVIFPAARPGLAHGAYLAVTRIAEDTAVMMLTGAVIDGVWPEHLTEPFTSLSVQILFGMTEYRNSQQMHQILSAAVVLMLLTLILSVLGKKLVKGKSC